MIIICESLSWFLPSSLTSANFRMIFCSNNSLTNLIFLEDTSDTVSVNSATRTLVAVSVSHAGSPNMFPPPYFFSPFLFFRKNRSTLVTPLEILASSHCAKHWLFCSIFNNHLDAWICITHFPSIWLVILISLLNTIFCLRQMLMYGCGQLTISLNSYGKSLDNAFLLLG